MSHRQAMLRGARVLLAGWMLAACTPVPSGPHVMVYPGRGKSLYAFDADDASCRAWAASRVDESPQQAATDATVGGAAIGTLLGGAAGAALGAAAGNPAMGAAAGAGVGLLRDQLRCRERAGGRVVDPATLRRRLRAVHVRERQPGAGGTRASTGATFRRWSADPAAAVRCAAATAARHVVKS